MSKGCSGLSLQVVKKIIMATGYHLRRNEHHFQRVLKNLVFKGVLQQLKGTGAWGSFGVGKGWERRKRKQRPRRSPPKDWEQEAWQKEESWC